MQFKVGDRVEVLEPAGGVGITQENNTGLGSVVRVDKHGCQLEIKVDDNDRAWWYGLDKVRRAMTVPKPTPSITVGTQVRLTGVVRALDEKTGSIGVEINGCPSGYAYKAFIRPEAVEVIRQPFKRGEEVAYDHVSDNAPDDEWALVIRDEGPDGMFWMVYKHLEAKVHQRHFSEFKRRPERRP